MRERNLFIAKVAKDAKEDFSRQRIGPAVAGLAARIPEFGLNQAALPAPIL